jgi:hypothetical protein
MKQDFRSKSQHTTAPTTPAGLTQARREQSSADGDSGDVLGEHECDGGLLG